MTKYTDQELKSEIINFIALNPGVTYSTMKKTLAERFHVSVNRVNSNYQELKKDDLIVVKSISQMKGGHEGHELTLKPTSFLSELQSLATRLDTYEQEFKKYYPSLRTNKIMITQKNGIQLVSKKVESDLGFFIFTLDNMFTEISALSLMKTNGFIKKDWNRYISQLEKRVIDFIIKSITQLLDQESKPSKKSRWNLLIYLRTNLKWLIKFEKEKPNLFFKGNWLKNGVSYGMS